MTPMCFIGFAEYLRSTKGGVQLVLNEFMYYKGEARGPRVSWRCIDYQRAKCKAWCQTVDGVVTRTSGTHEHAPHTETIRKRRQRQEAWDWAGQQLQPLPSHMQPQQHAQQPQPQGQGQGAHVWHV